MRKLEQYLRREVAGVRIEVDLTHVGDERLMDSIGHQGSNNLVICSENQVKGLQSTKTHDGLSTEAILLAVMLKVVENLGTRYYKGGR